MSGFFRLMMGLMLLAMPVQAQTPPPTIVEFWTKADSLFLEITLNAEMFLAGIDPETHPDLTDNAGYRALRQRVSSELEPEVRAFVTDWKARLQVEAGGPVVLAYEGVRIPVVGDTAAPRISRLLLTAPLPNGASNLRLTWPEGHGPVVLKQQQVAAPYTGYLIAGESSPSIPLQGGAALSPEQAVQVFFPKGFSRILPNGLQEIALVLALVFLSLTLRAAIAQMVFLSIGLVFGLALSVYGALGVSPFVASLTLTSAIVILALWNLILRRLHVFRLLAVFAAGLLLGNVLSASVIAIGVPPDHLPPAILGFAGGAVAALSAVAAAGYAGAALISGGSHRMRGRVSVLASILIAGVGVYWMVAPWMLS